MEDMLIAVLSMMLILLLVPLYLWKRRQDSRAAAHVHDEEPQAPERENVVRATGARRMRRRPAAGASTSAAAVAAEDIGDESDEEEEGIENEGRGLRKKNKKRQEREAQRQAELAAQDSRLAKQDRYAEMRRRKDEEREAEERRLEDEAKARQAKEEAAAALEFEKWKGAFSIDAEGTTENEAQENQDLLSEFVEYIKVKSLVTNESLVGDYLKKKWTISRSKKHKCVPLEDLAAEFRLRTQECINRINSLETIGRLSGVMDDRGKYIYISLEEMKAVAKYIKCEGRVSISHLARKSNQFIDLEPKAPLEELVNVDEIVGA